jgi:lysophospholipase L1-like esterase
VTLTIGGNDVQFVPIAATCLAIADCQTKWGPIVTGLIAHTEPRLRKLYQEILRDAPNAQVYVLGYPHIIDKHPSLACQHVIGYDGIQPDEAAWIARMVTKLDDAISQAVSEAGSPSRLHYVSTLNTFSGGEACSRSGSTGGAYMNGVVFRHPKYSFHPNRDGHVLLASALAHAVRSTGLAFEVPGTAALNAGGAAAVDSVSCASAGNCSAGGWYLDSSGGQQAFVVSQVNGTRNAAIKVPGTAALNTVGAARVDAVSCGSAGNCSAGGYYTDSSGQHAFVVNEVNGTWQGVLEVPGTAGGYAEVLSVSCASAGNCSAGGYDLSSAFVVNEVNGTWNAAIEVPSITALNTRGNAGVSTVSCASTGNCSAGGYYTGGAGHEAFVVSQVKGTWNAAIEVPGTAALNKGGIAYIASVSCGSAANCGADGIYTDGSSRRQVFVVSRVNGTWQTAIEAPGTAALDKGGYAEVYPSSAVSCASAGNCSASGYYTGSTGHQAFVARQVNGTWHAALEVPGIAALSTGREAEGYSVSCGSAGNCGAGGYYDDRSGQHAFIVSQVNGTWHAAVEVPGIAALDRGGAAVAFSVSCTAAGNCTAGGWYTDKSRHTQAAHAARQSTGRRQRRQPPIPEPRTAPYPRRSLACLIDAPAARTVPLVHRHGRLAGTAENGRKPTRQRCATPSG